VSPLRALRLVSNSQIPSPDSPASSPLPPVRESSACSCVGPIFPPFEAMSAFKRRHFSAIHVFFFASFFFTLGEIEPFPTTPLFFPVPVPRFPTEAQFFFLFLPPSQHAQSSVPVDKGFSDPTKCNHLFIEPVFFFRAPLLSHCGLSPPLRILRSFFLEFLIEGVGARLPLAPWPEHNCAVQPNPSAA